MVYCWKCGSQVGEQAALCPKCGATLRGTMGVQSPTGFELLRDDKSIQNHWARRVLAILIDAAVVSLVVAGNSAKYSLFSPPWVGVPAPKGGRAPPFGGAGGGGWVGGGSRPLLLPSSF